MWVVGFLTVFMVVLEENLASTFDVCVNFSDIRNNLLKTYVSHENLKSYI